MTAPLRIALVSTPRSGNTWIRHLLGHAYALPMLSRHAVPDDEWGRLPPECVLQIHWRREPDFLAKLRDHGFRVLTLARHPLDTLISILHVCVYDVESENWLGGRGGDESPLWAAWPRSRAFLDYATGPRAAELLAVSAEWWHDPSAVRVKYEAFVRDAAGELRKLAEAFGPHRCANLDEAVAKASLGEMRKSSTNNHFWKGQPGLWREFLPAPEASQIAWAHQANFAALGYELDPHPGLDGSAADANWVRLVGPELGRTLRKNTEGHHKQLSDAWAAVRTAGEAAKAAFRERDVALAFADAAQMDRDAARGERAALALTHGKALAEVERLHGERDEVCARAADDVHAAQTATDAATLERNDLHTTLADCLADLSAAGGELAELRAEHAATLAEAARVPYLAEANAALADELADARQARDALQSHRALLEAELRQHAAALREGDGRLESLGRSFATMQTEQAALRAGVAEAARRAAEAEAEAEATSQAALREAGELRAEFREELLDVRGELDEACGEAADLRSERDAARVDAAQLREQVSAHQRAIEPYRGLHGSALQWAWRVQRWQARFPWPTRMLGKVFRPH